jgi:nucleoside-diphosphate-sugar epimerase
MDRGLAYREVNRNPTVDRPNQWKADLLNPADAERCIEGSTHVYLCVGLPYSSAVWEAQWEVLMRNVIAACEKTESRLIFLDNVYMYSPPLPVPFDETTPQAPVSRKGRVRKRVADLLMTAMEEERIRGLIGRAADFIGPGARNSVFYILFLENMLKGKPAQTLFPKDIQHTYTNVQDCGRALVELAINEDCYGESWHLPVGDPATVKDIHGLFNQSLNADLPLKVMPAILRSLLKPFIAPMRELDEMMYQFHSPYIMSDEKFRKRFPEFKVSTNEETVEAMVKWFRERNR